MFKIGSIPVIVKCLYIFFIAALALSLAPLTVAHAAGDLPSVPTADAALHPQPAGLGQGMSLTFVPVITATKVYTISVDGDSDNKADPGDTLIYTVTIRNSGDQNATNTVFNDTIDDNTAFVPGSLQTTPLARNDTYSTVGNVQLTVPVGTGVLLNDSDPDGSGGLAVASFSATSANSGQVNVAANGSFTYNPPPGFSGTDTFSYTVNDGEGNTNGATVSITVGQVVWFIDNTVGGPGDGRFTSPFNSVANFNSLAADDPGDTIFVYQGAGAYSTAFTLLNNQQLIGHGVGLTISPNLSIAAASRPTIANVTLGSGNTVRGLNVSVSSGTGISGASVGALTINNVSVTNTAGVGVSLTGGNSSMAVTFDSVSSSGGANGIFLSQNSGSFTSNSGTIDPTTGHGIQVSNTAVGPLNFTLTNSTVTGAPASFNGINFDIPTSGSFGTITIQNNTISNNGSTGLRTNIQGTGSISKIDIITNTFTSNDIGVDLATNGTASIDFDIRGNNMTGTRTQANIAANDPVHNNGVGPTMEGYIRNNTITASPAGNTFIALWVVSDGDGNITLGINNNNITNFGDSGIDVESRGGTGDVHATITSNTASTTAAVPLAGMFLRSGNGTPGETSLLCVNATGNNMSVGAGAVAHYYLDRFNPATTVFQIQGLTAGTTPADAEARMLAVNTASGVGAGAFAETGAYTNATCTTVSFVSAPYTGPMYAGASEHAPAETTLPALSQAVSVPSVALTGGYRGLASPLLAPITPVNLGTLNPGEVIIITFEVTIDDPLADGVTQVANQGNVTADGGINVLTDDPTTPAPNDATVTPIDLPEVSISAGTNPSEAGPITGTFVITLTGSAPASGLTVNYNLTGSSASVADYSLAAGANISALSASTFTIASGASSATIIIVPVDDLVDDDGETVQMTLDSGSGYIVGTSVATRTIIDNDTRGVTVSAPSVNVTEGGATAQYNIRLDTVPTATVTISFNTGTQINAITSLTFPADLTALDPQTVTVTATDDALVEGDHTGTISHSASGGGYDGESIANVTANITDNDIAYSLAANQATVAEGDTGPTPISFTLTRTGDITRSSSVDFSFGGTATNVTDYDNVVPIGSTVNFGAGVTQTAITLDVLGDFIDEANETITISLSAATGTGGGGTGTISGSPASTTIIDDDSAGVSVNPTSLTIGEPNTTGVFTITLTSQPTATVTITLVSTDTTECSVPGSVSLDSVNWNTGAPVTVTAVDDPISDGPQPCTIQTGTTSSTDPTYNGTFNPADVNITVNDDDVPGISITPTTGLTTTETGGTATFTVRLRTEPTAGVTLTLTSGDTSEGTINPTSVSFTTLNWNIPQTVTVTGVNDDVDDGGQTYTIITNDPTSSDPNYDGAGANPADVSVTNLDDDTAGIIVSAISGNTSEDSITATFTISLTSQPTSSIGIALTSTDLTEGTVNPTSINFTTLNWNIPQTVTVTGVDDPDTDGNITYTIQIGPVTGGDSLYTSLDPPDVTLVNQDNEFAGIFLPLILKDFIPAPNLVVDNLVATSSGVVVTVKNIGNAPVVDAFWVDVYLNPTTAPTHVNQRWQDLGSQGLIWGVQGAALPLDPGESLTLTIGDAYYFGSFSNFTPPLTVGSQVFAQFDSVNFSTTYGNVRESHEISGGIYDNIAQTVSIAGAAEAEETVPSQVTPNSLGRLPAR